MLGCGTQARMGGVMPLPSKQDVLPADAPRRVVAIEQGIGFIDSPGSKIARAVLLRLDDGSVLAVHPDHVFKPAR